MKIKNKHLILIFALIIGKTYASFGLGAAIGQLAATATGVTNPNTNIDSGTKPEEGKSDGISMNSPLAAISAAKPGIDPSSMDAEVKMPISTDASIPPKPDPNAPPPISDSGASGENASVSTPSQSIDFDLLWSCKRNSVIKDKEKCATAMQFFCAGRCTRLNCAILTNRAICLDVCGSNNPMMEPCVMAGKQKAAISTPMQNFPAMGGGGYSPMMTGGMGMMDPNMAGAAMLGSAAASGVGALASGIGSLFGGGKKDDGKSKSSSSKTSSSGSSSPEETSDVSAAQAEMTGAAPGDAAATAAATAASVSASASASTDQEAGKKKKKKKKK